MIFVSSSKISRISSRLLIVGGLSGAAFFSVKDSLDSSGNSGIIVADLAGSAYSGYIPADFSVEESGSPRYRLPINVPPGTNNIQPAISLVYSNARVNGILGVGWSLDGLLMITRTGKIFPQDDTKQGINLDAGDRFTINGQRLIAYRDKRGNLLKTIAERNAAHGKDGTEYRTEIESWSRVYSYGDCAGGPCSFKVYAKDGSVTEFAETPDSRIQPTNSPVVMIWAVNKVTDRNGNYIKINYKESEYSGTFIPTQILYTGNEQGRLQPQRMLEFVYEARKDSGISYLNGVQIACVERIKKINTYVDLDGNGKNINTSGNLVNQYTIHYSYSSSTGRSLIDSIVLADQKGSSIPKTTFNWSSINTSDFFADTVAQLPKDFSKVLSEDVEKIKADFNGDGKTDIALLKPYASSIPVITADDNFGLNTVQYPVPEKFRPYLHASNVEPVISDFNGDGLTDIAFFKNHENNIAVLYSSQSQRFEGRMQPLSAGFNTKINSSDVKKYTGDFNGDGLTDIAGFKNGYTTIPLLLTQPGGGFNCLLSPIPADIRSFVNSPNAMQSLGDFNGDGLTDIAVFSTGYQSIPILFSDGFGNFRSSLKKLPQEVQSYFNSAGVERITGDFNGDGLTDFSVFKKGYSSVPLILSKGDGSFEFKKVVLPAGASDLIQNGVADIVTGDFNGDDQTDFISFNTDYESVGALFSKGGGEYEFLRIKLTSDVAKSINAKDVQRFVSDFNGDGLLDVAAIKRGFTKLPVLVSNKINTTNSSPDLLLYITNGIGRRTEISYQPFAETSDHNSDSVLQYPLMSIQSPQFVVSKSVIRNNNTNNPSSVIAQNYYYESAVIDHYRGWLGFKRVIIDDPQLNTRTISEYIPAFPFTGVLKKKEIVDLSDHSKVLGKVYYDYKSEQISNTGVFHLWNTGYTVSHYTKGHYNYTIRKDFVYDGDHKNVILVHDLADTAILEDDIYTGFRYGNYDLTAQDWWKGFFPVSERVWARATGHDWNTWTGHSLCWRRYLYDRNMNLIQSESFLDHDGGKQVNSWIASNTKYDLFGNAISQSDPPNYSVDSIVSAVQYDAVFHTFPVFLNSPVPMPGREKSASLQTKLAFDPRFGTKMLEIDPNGHAVMRIPDKGVDGFGRLLIVQGIMPFEEKPATVAVINHQQEFPDGYSIKLSTTRNWTDKVVPGPDWQWQIERYDGFERNIKTESNAYSKTTRVISAVSYNSKGFPEKNFLPFFSNLQNEIYYSQDSSLQREAFFTEQKYDQYGELKEVWSPSASNRGQSFLANEYIYDSADSRIVYIREPSPADDTQFILWKKEVDSKGRLRRKSGPYYDNYTLAPNFSESVYRYDPLDRLLEVTDPLGQKSIYRYNSIGQLIWEYQPETDTVKHTFNANGWLLSSKDANGEVMWKHDDLGRVIRETVKAADQPRADTVKYIYDNNDLFPNSRGRLAKVILPNVEYSYRYDNTGMLSTEKIFFKDLGKTFVHGFVYDAQGNVISSVYPDSSIAAYVYDDANNLLFVSLDGDTLASYKNYNSRGNYERVAYRNGVHSSFNYDHLGRLIRSLTEKGAYKHALFNYRWNKANKVLAITDLRKNREFDFSQWFSYYPSGRLNTAKGLYEKELFSYDAAGNRVSDLNYSYEYSRQKRHQLISVKEGNDELYEFTYDRAGNLSGKRISKRAIEERAKFLKQSSDNRTNDSYQLTYHFDAQANLRTVQTKLADSFSIVNTFNYNHEGERVSKKDADGTETFYISPVCEIVKTPKGELTFTKYVWDEDHIIYSNTGRANQIHLITDISQNKKTGGSLLPAFFADFLDHISSPVAFLLVSLVLIFLWCIYQSIAAVVPSVRSVFCLFNYCSLIRSLSRVWAFGLMFWCSMLIVAEPVFAEIQPGKNGAGIPEESNEQFFHHGHLGSAMLATDKNGGLSSSLVYEPFGNVDKKGSSGSDNFRYKFTGKEWDEYIGLYYFGSRYYDSSLGRFISPDPARQYHSPYLYGDDDPLSGTDPNGEEFFTATTTALIIGAIAGAFTGAGLLNNTFNPLEWKWDSADTWIGLAGGALAGAAVAEAGAALSAFGASSAKALSVTVNTAFLIADTYNFAEDNSLTNAIFVAIDVVAFAAPLLGKSEQAAGLSRGTPALLHEAEEASVAGKEIEMMEFHPCAMSFPAGILVQTPNGSKTIESVQVGDEVVAYDPETAKTGAYAVTKLFRRIAAGLVLLVTSANDTIAVTPEHPFYVSDKGWIEAAQLQEGDRLFSASHTAFYTSSKKDLDVSAPVSISQIKFIKDTVAQAYNFEVEKVHNYFVSTSIILVHNGKCPGGTLGKRAKAGEATTGYGGPHNNVKNYSNKGLYESNHMPPSASYNHTLYAGISVGDRPATRLPYELHRRVKSTGSSKAAKSWRNKQRKLLNKGEFAKAMENDINDVLGKATKKQLTGVKNGLDKMINYAAFYNTNRQPLISKYQSIKLRSLVRNY